MDTAKPPVQVAPAGSRYAVDPEEKYVEWMGFSFYIGFTRDAGMALYDIRYQGERLIYELSLQEALAHYAGNDPMQSGTAYLDTYYGFGPYAFELGAFSCLPNDLGLADLLMQSRDMIARRMLLTSIAPSTSMRLAAITLTASVCSSTMPIMPCRGIPLGDMCLSPRTRTLSCDMWRQVCVFHPFSRS